MAGRDAFLQAVGAGDARAVRAALSSDPTLANVDVVDGTPLHLAVRRNHGAIVRLLVQAGADLEARNAEGRTPLHDALEYNNEVRELLLELGAELDICAAAFLDRLDRIGELLDGDPALVNDDSTRLSPLGWASFSGAVDAAELLIARGARMDDGELLCAASVNGVAVGRVLLHHGADPDAIDPQASGNALHAAASMKYTQDSTAFVRLLIDAGVDVNGRTSRGKTALDIVDERAAAGDDRRPALDSVARLLREHGGRRSAEL